MPTIFRQMKLSINAMEVRVALFHFALPRLKVCVNKNKASKTKVETDPDTTLIA